MKFLLGRLFCFIFSGLSPAYADSDNNNSTDSDYYTAFKAMTVGVADLDVVLNLWVGEFGFNIVSQKEGDDPELARLWGLETGDIARQALIRNKDNTAGMIHFVQFNNPDEPVRKDANNFDLTPKNLDIWVRDLPEKMADLKTKGYNFRNPKHGEFKTGDGWLFRDIQLLSPDDVNLGMLEMVGKKENYNDIGIAGLSVFVFTVSDIEKESKFFESIFMLDQLSVDILEGPAIEKMVGLPPGTALKIYILGREGFGDGKIEIIEYAGVKGNDLYARAKPKALGILHATYVVPDTKGLKARLKEQGAEITEHGHMDTLIGKGNVISFISPAGLKIEVYDEE